MDNKIILTIGRQFGSGGREVGQKLAKELGLPENEEILMIMDLGHAAPGAVPLPNHGSRKPLADTVAYL